MRKSLFIVGLLFSIFLSATEYRLQFFDDRDGLSHWHTSRIRQDSTGFIWIATWNGLNRFDGSRFVAFKTNPGDSISTPSDKIRRIELTEQNNLICVVEDSLYLFNTHTYRYDTLPRTIKEEINHLYRVKHDPDLSIPKEIYTQLGNLTLRNIRYDYIDRDENHWLVDDHGLYIATPVIERGRRINHEEVRYMRRMQNGEIWMALRYTNKVMVYDSSLNLLRTVDFGRPVYCILETEPGHVWLGTKPGGLIELTNGRLREYAHVRNIYDIKQDAQGQLWIASFGFGLWHSSEKGFVQVPGTEHLFARRLLMIEDGALFAATTSGLLVYKNDSIMLLQREAANPSSLSSNAVMCIAQIDETLYMGTEGGGLNRITMDNIRSGQWIFEHTTTKDGLYSDIIYEIVPYSDTLLLLQGNSALTLMNRYNGEITHFESSFFNYTDGQRLIMGEVPPMRLNDSVFLLAPVNGVIQIQASDLKQDTHKVRIAISAVQKSQGAIDYAVDTITQIVLSSNERAIRLWYAALDYRNCGNILYSSRFYRKGEAAPAWSTATSTSEIDIPDLQPGEYTLEICSTNAYRQWQNNTRGITIIVKPTFLESNFGKALVFVLILAVLLTITITLLHMQAMKQKRQEALNAYLELQERLTQLTNQPSSVAGNPHPVPEILVAGYLSQNEQFIQTLTAFMEANMGNTDISVDDLINATGLSRSSLNRKMHELFNLSPKDFLQAARIKHACSLLKQTDLSVKEIAYACGFSSPHYFATCFKNSTGVTPSEYRE